MMTMRHPTHQNEAMTLPLDSGRESASEPLAPIVYGLG